MDQRVSVFEEKNHKIIDELNSVSEILKRDDFNFRSDTNKLINIIQRVKKYQKLEIQNRQDFLEKKLEMMVWILEQSKSLKISIFGNLFLMYTEFSDIYINFVLNLKQENLFDKEHMTKLNRIWSDGVLAILQDFKKISEK
jgi:hypothetical protein